MQNLNYWSHVGLCFTGYPFYIETKGQNLDIISDIQIGITFLIFTLEQICNYDFKGISKLFPVVAVLLRFNILKKIDTYPVSVVNNDWIGVLTCDHRLRSCSIDIVEWVISLQPGPGAVVRNPTNDQV